jgi:hypothetical protein
VVDRGGITLLSIPAADPPAHQCTRAIPAVGVRRLRAYRSEAHVTIARAH